jgi:hypothetical protein
LCCTICISGLDCWSALPLPPQSLCARIVEQQAHNCTAQTYRAGPLIASSSSTYQFMHCNAQHKHLQQSCGMHPSGTTECLKAGRQLHCWLIAPRAQE